MELVGVGRWGVAVLGGGLRRNILEAEGRATQWSRGAGRRLRVDGLCGFGGFSIAAHSHAEMALEQVLEMVGV